MRVLIIICWTQLLHKKKKKKKIDCRNERPDTAQYTIMATTWGASASTGIFVSRLHRNPRRREQGIERVTSSSGKAATDPLRPVAARSRTAPVGQRRRLRGAARNFWDKVPEGGFLFSPQGDEIPARVARITIVVKGEVSFPPRPRFLLAISLRSFRVTSRGISRRRKSRALP